MTSSGHLLTSADDITFVQTLLAAILDLRARRGKIGTLYTTGKMWKIRIFQWNQMLLTCIQYFGAGSAVLLELFASRRYFASYHAYHVYPCPVFL